MSVDSVISLCGILAIMLVAGCLAGLTRRDSFSMSWLLVAAALVAINDILLTRAFGLMLDVLPGADMNWQGKILALGATLAIASLPSFGWRRTGISLGQDRDSLKSTIPAALLYCAFFAAIALMFPNEETSRENIAFQLTMPGLEEELFYRGVLLYALCKAFSRRWRFLGVDWSWGALLSCMLFGLGHAFGFSDGHFSFDPMYMALTAVPSLLAVWMRLRTGSVLLPVLLHNFGNSIMLLL